MSLTTKAITIGYVVLKFSTNLYKHSSNKCIKINKIFFLLSKLVEICMDLYGRLDLYGFVWTFI